MCLPSFYPQGWHNLSVSLLSLEILNILLPSKKLKLLYVIFASFKIKYHILVHFENSSLLLHLTLSLSTPALALTLLFFLISYVCY